MQNVVEYTAPKLRNLPAALTPEAILAASLPLKIDQARQAIAKCDDLSELIARKDQVDAMAAAIKTLRHTTPEMVRSINRMCKEAVLRLGQMVDAYAKGLPPQRGLKGDYSQTLTDKRARSQVCKDHALTPLEVTTAVRLNRAPRHVQERILADDSIGSTHSSLTKHLPKLQNGGGNGWLSNEERCQRVSASVKSARKTLSAHNLGEFKFALANSIERVSKRAAADIIDDGSGIHKWVSELRALLTDLEEKLDDVYRAAGLDRLCNAEPDVLLFTEEAAKMLGVSARTMHKWQENDSGPRLLDPPKRIARRLQWSKNSILNVIEAAKRINPVDPKRKG